MVALVSTAFVTTFYYTPEWEEPTETVRFDASKAPVYILQSDLSRVWLEKVGADPSDYINTLATLKRGLESLGYRPSVIREEAVGSLDGGVLLAMDAFALDASGRERIQRFVKRGGGVIFNYTTGFQSGGEFYPGDSMLREITGLAQSKKNPFITRNEKEGFFFLPRLLSPLQLGTGAGKRLNVVLYDDLPRIVPPVGLEADGRLADWSMTSPPRINGTPMRFDESGALWHGYYGKGRWVYTLFPLYVFFGVQEERVESLKLLDGMIRYAAGFPAVRPYPFEDAPSGVMVSEDTEFHFENVAAFTELVNRYRIRATAFCVGSLALKNKELVRSLDKEYLEIASHSYSHTELLGADEAKLKKETEGAKEILELMSGETVIGFRPPREEIDANLAKWLEASGFKYVMEKERGQLYPFKKGELLIIPRVGNDDYSYFVGKYAKNDAYAQMLREMRYITSLDGLYTLSVHTHLFSHGDNIEVLEKFFDSLKDSGIRDMSGSDVFHRITRLKQLALQLEKVGDSWRVTAENRGDDDMKRVGYRFYWPSPDAPKDVISEEKGIRIYHNRVNHYTDITLPGLTSGERLGVSFRY
jgi:peptidoglycan/xylan/chitin deacetylase (PgdA/CDA1 family)